MSLILFDYSMGNVSFITVTYFELFPVQNICDSFKFNSESNIANFQYRSHLDMRSILK